MDISNFWRRKTKTAIARTLNQNPKLILADEPVSNLDTYYTGRVMGLFRGLVEKKKKIIFVHFMTHNLYLNLQITP